MNRLKAISVVIVVLSIFSAVLYTSCKKDACVGVTCFNNAPCNNGTCTCPLGFSGTQCAVRSITNIIYQNNTLTDVTISVNASGVSGNNTIMPGNSYEVTGNYGTNVIGSATTAYSSSSGQTLSWNLNDTFPASGVTIVPINVPSTYFYLYIINNNTSYYVSQAVINYNLPSQTTISDLYINSSSGSAYPVGYFRSEASCNVRLSEETYYTWPVINFTLPGTINQTYTAIVN